MSDEPVAPSKGGKKWLIILVLLAIFAMGGGAAVPFILGAAGHGGGHSDNPKPKKSEPPVIKQVAIPFDTAVVNLEGSRGRYLRVKLLVATEIADEREVTELLAKQKPFLKTWLLGYLSDHSAQEISSGGKVALNRIRHDIGNYFNATLYPNGEEKIRDILFDEYLVQY